MHGFRARLTAAAAALAFALAGGGAAGADTLPQGGGADHVVLARTSTDGAVDVRAATQLAHAGGPNVTSTNLADATSDGCTDCHATAVAVQVLFVTGSPQYFAPANVAAAVNDNCTACSAFAYAWQYVLPVDGPVHLSAQGELEVHELSDEIRDTAAAIVPHSLDDAAALRARLDALTAQLAAVVRQEAQLGDVHPAGPPAVHARADYRD